MVDPSTQADSGILVVFAQLTAGLLFFALGLDREVIRAFARSLDAFPAGSFALAPAGAEQILRLASGMFSVGLRLAMPAMALLLLVDLALALLGRLNAQLQLLMLAFPDQDDGGDRAAGHDGRIVPARLSRLCRAGARPRGARSRGFDVQNKHER